MITRLSAVLAALVMVAACETTPDDAAMRDAAGGAQARNGDMAGDRAPVTQQEARLPPPTISAQQELVQNVGDRVFYAFDSAVVSPQGEATLRRQAEWLRSNPSVRIILEGHADERGTREYNLALGDRRAAAAKNYLVSLGIDPSRITTISYGKERPIATGHNESAWSQNRVAVTVVQ